VSNYHVNKATFGADLVLDPAIQLALSRVVAADKDGSKTTLSVTNPLTNSAGLKNVDKLTDVLTFNLSSNQVVDLSKLSNRKGKSEDDSSKSGSLDVIAFNNDMNVDLKLASFKGVVLLGNGNDKVSGGGGSLAINAGGGNDTITTGSNSDTIVGGDGNDSISSGSGKDLVKGGAGNDRIDSGRDNDTVYTGSGSDTILAGDGDDRIIIEAIAGDAQVVDGGKGSRDVLDLSGVTVSGAAQAGATVTITLDGGATVAVTGIERFMYDTNGATAGGVVTVGLSTFLGDFTV
jgi:Ca2+-binding RTX toxin-like protein